MATQTLAHQVQGRRSAMWSALWLGLALLAIGLARGAPPVVLAIWLTAACVAGWAVWSSPEYGCRISGRRLILSAPTGETRYALDEIEAIELIRFADEEDWRIHLKDGRNLPLPNQCLPRRERMEAVLAVQGIPLLVR